MISNAAERQMVHIRSASAGPHRAEAQKLLNQIAKARICLLDAKRRANYDAELRRLEDHERGAAGAPVAIVTSENSTAAVTQSDTSASSASGLPRTATVTAKRRAAQRRQPRMGGEVLKVVLGGSAGVALGLLVLQLAFDMDVLGIFGDKDRPVFTAHQSSDDPPSASPDSQQPDNGGSVVAPESRDIPRSTPSRSNVTPQRSSQPDANRGGERPEVSAKDDPPMHVTVGDEGDKKALPESPDDTEPTDATVPKQPADSDSRASTSRPIVDVTRQEPTEEETIALEATGSQGDSLTNSLGMAFHRLPAGEFVMGLQVSKGFRSRSDVSPDHRVIITKPFFIATHEVTQQQYRKVMGNNPSYWSKDGEGSEYLESVDTADLPVESVSWQEASEFCQRLSERDEEQARGHAYRLPTEAEWEYACRASSSTAYYFGNDRSRLADFAWFGNNSGRTEIDANAFYSRYGDRYIDRLLANGNRTRSVGTREPNDWTLYDMHGNVWEWCADWYGGDYYSKSPLKDPTGPTSGKARVIRGGSWANDSNNCRSCFRRGAPPDMRHEQYGFRVVCVVQR